jgi:hypothetical protein
VPPKNYGNRYFEQNCSLNFTLYGGGKARLIEAGQPNNTAVNFDLDISRIVRITFPINLDTVGSEPNTDSDYHYHINYACGYINSIENSRGDIQHSGLRAGLVMNGARRPGI